MIQWQDCIHKEELVSVLRLPDTEGILEQASEQLPDSIKSLGGGTYAFINDQAAIRLKPGMALWEDSIGDYHVSDIDFFDLLFRPLTDADDSVDVMVLAEALYETYMDFDRSYPSDWEFLSESEREPYKKQAEKISEDFYIARRL